MTNFFKNKQLPKISKIAPQALKPQNLDEFGYFLDGLMDSDGSITQEGNVRIAFHVNEIRLE